MVAASTAASLYWTIVPTALCASDACALRVSILLLVSVRLGDPGVRHHGRGVSQAEALILLKLSMQQCPPLQEKGGHIVSTISIERQASY